MRSDILESSYIYAEETCTCGGLEAGREAPARIARLRHQPSHLCQAHRSDARTALALRERQGRDRRGGPVADRPPLWQEHGMVVDWRGLTSGLPSKKGACTLANSSDD